ncbi:MAG TPA: hypothetical protein VL993_12045, partial [Stellaceae bacterium]|nr:hypothetical protein [Stellaceae bacterium]
MTGKGSLAAPSRRAVLGSLAAAAGAASMGWGRPAAAAPTHKGVIDLHHHFWAPEYLKAQDDWEDAHHVPHFPTMQQWSPQMSLEEMDKGGVQTAVVSLASI